ncbi:hypothetical protein BO82DRAFT_33408 [Aspergillus uvarum CBS 121591]|uniref:Uncharacterized protein n=1 Tax=Aspergillus uvarum CBS 121591 TaxID=1448315 RepID=A0A319CA55_9EURO|nr:hypothetical protein BO82DRAFT_33408 [Aspergillus uvarum CBS 121591]PYH75363.1 hypothetical protein BO82DRAFT_33408 [Aspergillus uvarum CBS 121591]
MLFSSTRTLGVASAAPAVQPILVQWQSPGDQFIVDVQTPSCNQVAQRCLITPLLCCIGLTASNALAGDSGHPR